MPVDPLATGHVVEVVHAYEVDGQVCMNVFHYVIKEVSTTPDFSYYDAMSDFCKYARTEPGHIVSGWQDLASADCTSLWVQAQRVRPVRDHSVREISGLTGVPNGPSAPSACALSLTKRSETVGRGKAGHIQIGGIPVANIEDGLWSAATVNAAQDYADEIELGIPWGSDGTSSLCLMPRDPAGAIRDVIDIIAQREVRAMRRRVVGRGI